MHQLRTAELYSTGVIADGACYDPLSVHWATRSISCLALVGAVSGCPRPKAPAPPQRNAAGILVTGRPIFAVLPAESERFPRAAKRATELMADARLDGVDPPQLSNISLEMLQISIECIDPSAACYEAVGKALQANQILFTEIGPGRKKKQVKVRVALFDVDTRELRGNETKVFPSEAAAEQGVGDVIAKVTGR
jgi:hypothetical protein